MKKRKKFAAGAALAVGAALAPEIAEAATITVNTTNDNATPGTNGLCSLREAVANANDNGATFPDCTAGDPGLDTIDFSVTGPITLAGVAMDITDSLIIDGPGETDLIIDANLLSRHFLADDGDSTTILDVTIRDLTLTNGNDSSESLTNGGAILSEENLTLISTTISLSNTVVSGGAVSIDGSYYDPVTLTVQDSTFTLNTAACCGGAIDAHAAHVDISNSFITGNTATGGTGGGIAMYYPGNVSITGTTIDGNQAPAGVGGGLYLYGSTGSFTIADSTISQNDAALGGGVGLRAVGGFLLDRVRIIDNDATAVMGGAAFLYALGEIVNSQITGNETAGSVGGIGVEFALVGILNSTVANNTAGIDAGGIGISDALVGIALSTISGNTATTGSGGNILFYDSGYGGASLYLDNSIVANGTAVNGPDIYDSYGGTVANYTLIEDPAFVPSSGANNIIGTDPQLGPLQNNGGPTETLRPAAASPAVNAGDPAFTPPPSTDQRFYPRPIGIVDMGAVELQPGTFAFSSPTYSVSEDGVSVTITVNRLDPPVGAAVVDFATAGGTATSGVDFVPNSGPLNFVNGQTSATFNVLITDDALVEGPETFTVTLTGPSEALGSPSAATVTIADVEGPAPFADLSISKVVNGSGPFVAGQNVTFTITVTNSGTIASSATVSDVLPLNTTFVSATPSQGSCGGTTTVTCTLGSINPSANATIALTVTLNTAGSVSNTATVAGTQVDPIPTNNSDTAVINAAAAAAIPTLDEWMLLALATALAAFAATKLRP